jgi:hypothetical protein
MINHLTDFNLAGLIGTFIGIALDPLLFAPAICAGWLAKRTNQAFIFGIIVFIFYAAVSFAILQGRLRSFILEAAFFDIMILAILANSLRKVFSKK